MTINNPLKEKITPRLNLSGFTPEEKEEIVGMVLNIVKEKIFIAVLDSLSHKEREELGNMNEGEYKEKLGSFLETSIPQFRKIIENSADEIIGEFNAMRV